MVQLHHGSQTDALMDDLRMIQSAADLASGVPVRSQLTSQSPPPANMSQTSAQIEPFLSWSQTSCYQRNDSDEKKIAFHLRDAIAPIIAGSNGVHLMCCSNYA